IGTAVRYRSLRRPSTRTIPTAVSDETVPPGVAATGSLCPFARSTPPTVSDPHSTGSIAGQPPPPLPSGATYSPPITRYPELHGQGFVAEGAPDSSTNP